jgi:hypothetical protein
MASVIALISAASSGRSPTAFACARAAPMLAAIPAAAWGDSFGVAV